MPTPEVTDAMIDAAFNAELGCLSVYDLGDGYYRELHRDIMRAALEAALKAQEDAESRG